MVKFIFGLPEILRGKKGGGGTRTKKKNREKYNSTQDFGF